MWRDGKNGFLLSLFPWPYFPSPCPINEVWLEGLPIRVCFHAWKATWEKTLKINLMS